MKSRCVGWASGICPTHGAAQFRVGDRVLWTTTTGDRKGVVTRLAHAELEGWWYRVLANGHRHTSDVHESQLSREDRATK